MAWGQNLGVLCGFVACVLLAFWFSTVVAMGPVASMHASSNGAVDWLHWPNFQWWDWLNWWGLVLNFVGTLIVGLSIGKPRRGLIVDNSGEGGGITYFAAVLYPRAFWFGLGILAVGFLMQIALPWISGKAA